MGFFPLSSNATKGEKEIFPWITKGTSYIPQEWLSRNGEDKFPHEQRSCEWGNLFLPWLLSHEWGKYDVPWVMNGEIYPSLWLLTTGFTFTFIERKFDHQKLQEKLVIVIFTTELWIFMKLQFFHLQIRNGFVRIFNLAQLCITALCVGYVRGASSCVRLIRSIDRSSNRLAGPQVLHIRSMVTTVLLFTGSGKKKLSFP